MLWVDYERLVSKKKFLKRSLWRGHKIINMAYSVLWLCIKEITWREAQQSVSYEGTSFLKITGQEQEQQAGVT